MTCFSDVSYVMAQQGQTQSELGLSHWCAFTLSWKLSKMMAGLIPFTADQDRRLLAATQTDSWPWALGLSSSLSPVQVTPAVISRTITSENA